MASKVLGCRNAMGGVVCVTAAATFTLLFDTCSGLVCLRTLCLLLFLLFLSAFSFFLDEYLANLVGPASGLLISAH